MKGRVPVSQPNTPSRATADNIGVAGISRQAVIPAQTKPFSPVVQRLPIFEEDAEPEATKYFQEVIMQDPEANMFDFRMLKQQAISYGWKGLAELMTQSEMKLFEMKNTGKVEKKEKEEKEKEEDTLHLEDISGIFEEAMEYSRKGLYEVIAMNKESLVMDALFTATMKLQIYMITMEARGNNYPYPDLDNLNTTDDLQRGSDELAKVKRVPTLDNYSHVYNKAFGWNELEDEEKREILIEKGGFEKELADRIKIDAEKNANTWLKYAKPYIELKRAFLDGWGEHAHGAFEKRGFYYFLSGEQKEIQKLITGQGDTELVEPTAGKVTLATALKEVYNSAACHADAIQFIDMLGKTTLSTGTSNQDKKGGLQTEALIISELLDNSTTPFTGVRLRDSNHHSLVLLFERVGKDRLKGNKYDTVAGNNTEEILYFMEHTQPLEMKTSHDLVVKGLDKAVRQTEGNWEMEWEVFTINDLSKLGNNLKRQVSSTINSISESMSIFDKRNLEDESLLRFSGVDAIPATIEHLSKLNKEKPLYLEQKQREQEGIKVAEEEEQERRRSLSATFKEQLAAAKSKGDTEIKLVLTAINNQLGEVAVFTIAESCNIGMQKVSTLMKDVFEDI
ncbi:hypothetical protein [Chitinophaga pinensis]|uniref:Uncharacterized protein n=1 Tax=Chitinophaga pinensis (strain ATCC 43595 / DSM 2588 / LMG 13176 / NBRC 15968 / NCIMB 11800 / UQM 2034) TaxID=485918 RepID=A0A979GY93_CHIPD|nr:hypothetical protein [Chitinophaga pinensis]ACU63064.1 hypothetical protein Cpin_5640 [Chitinophaga pinensis DSM 2588]